MEAVGKSHVPTREKSLQYPLNGRMGGLHSWSEYFGEEKKFLAPRLVEVVA
jgi:hypothetical protein